MPNGVRRSGFVSRAGHGVQVNSGVISIDNSGSAIAGGGHITLAVVNGVNTIPINGDIASATTLDVAAPLYAEQPLSLVIKQGATPQPVTFGASVLVMTSPGPFTSSVVAGDTDFVKLIGANGSRWALAAFANGGTF